MLQLNGVQQHCGNGNQCAESQWVGPCLLPKRGYYEAGCRLHWPTFGIQLEGMLLEI
jgi:hypothetical protein